MISRSLNRVFKQKGFVKTSARYAGGGDKIPAIDKEVTDFDVIFVGKYLIL